MAAVGHDLVVSRPIWNPQKGTRVDEMRWHSEIVDRIRATVHGAPGRDPPSRFVTILVLQ